MAEQAKKMDKTEAELEELASDGELLLNYMKEQIQERAKEAGWLIVPGVVCPTEFRYWTTRAKAALQRLDVAQHDAFEGEATTSNMENALGVLHGVLAEYKDGHIRVPGPNGSSKGVDSIRQRGFWQWTKDHSLIVVGGLIAAAFASGAVVADKLATYDKNLESTRLLELLGQCKAPAEKSAKQSPPLELLATAMDYCGPRDAGVITVIQGPMAIPDRAPPPTLTASPSLTSTSLTESTSETPGLSSRIRSGSASRASLAPSTRAPEIPAAESSQGSRNSDPPAMRPAPATTAPAVTNHAPVGVQQFGDRNSATVTMPPVSP
ncbi:MAG: hypothetical protein ABSC94_31800 [Polyangiaceae bacterium]